MKTESFHPQQQKRRVTVEGGAGANFTRFVNFWQEAQTLFFILYPCLHTKVGYILRFFLLRAIIEAEHGVLILINKRVIKRLIPAPFSRLWRQGRDEWRYRRLKPYVTSYGFQLYGDANLDSSREASDEMDTVRQFLNQGAALIDIGANVGLFSCYASSKGHSVLAVEPQPRNVQLLCRNLSLNKLNVEVLPIALANEVGILPLYGGGQGASLRKGWGGMQATYSTLVPVSTVDRILAGRFANQPLIVKLDVEGHEKEVLLGSEQTLSRDNVAWLVEHGLTENFAGINPHFRELFELFWSYGYEAHSLSPSRLVTPEDVDRWVAQKSRDFGGIEYLFTK